MGCTQVITLPGTTADGHILSGRSMDYGDQDDYRPVNTAIAGCYRHRGFSVMFFGRYFVRQRRNP